jgi:hypothetical protein
MVESARDLDHFEALALLIPDMKLRKFVGREAFEARS